MPDANKSTDDLLERGFQLAYFIFPDRATAIQILRNAMSKLKVQSSREQKRTYWRDKNMKRKITRTVRSDEDALQWLIYCEAAHYEKQQELAALPTTRDLIVRYIKHLVQLTTAMSSFYVNVGLQRLLRNYNTSDAQRAYECLTEHYPGTEEYRRIKGVLMRELQARFPELLKTCRANHGEVRFEAFADQNEWADLVDDCLAAFTPWSTIQVCAKVAQLSSETGLLSAELFGKDRDLTHPDIIEANLCHMFIEPLCYDQLSQKLGLVSPRAKLAVPRFCLSSVADKDHPGGPPLKPSNLTRQEKKSILDPVEGEASRRKKCIATSLAVVVDGSELARIDDLDEGGKNYCQLREGAKLIEFWMLREDHRVLLATHWIEYTEWHGIADASAAVTLPNGRELLLELVPAAHGSETAGSASMFLACQRMSRVGAWRASMDGLGQFFNLPKVGLALASLMAAAGILGTVKYRLEVHRQEAVAQHLAKQVDTARAERDSLRQRLDERQGAASLLTYRLVPEDISVRSGEGATGPVVSVPPGVPAVILELPVNGRGQSYQAALQSFAENREVLRESALHPESRNGNKVVAFTVPSSLMEHRKHYIVDLYSTNAAGKLEKVRFFTFYVVKQ